LKTLKDKVNKILGNKQKVSPPKPIKPPVFNPTKTIRDWENFTFSDDITVCALCGEQEDCECFDAYYCPCGKKNRDCDWPQSISCPCRVCNKVWSECLCDKPDKFSEEDWLEIKAFKYSSQIDWDAVNGKFINEQLEKIDKEDDND
jgi:hypothetical protein